MRRGLARYRGDRGVLQTRDGRSLQGVLVGVYNDCVVLAAIRYLDEAKPHDLPGEAVIPLGNVSWFHRLSEGAP